MAYYISRKVSGSFDDVVARVIAGLKERGFGVLSDIDVKQTLHEKIGADFRPYRILGACNPPLALKALTAEDKIGVMLPCNVVVQDLGAEGVEIAAIDPTAAMSAIGNPKLDGIAADVRERLAQVVGAV